jgi:hypothetical protein
LGHYSRGLTRVSLASLVMASSFLCGEIRQLLVHVYPGGSKAPGAERITVPHYQQSCPPCLTYPSGGPTMNDEIAL